MALSNFSLQNAYVTITNIFYEKDFKRCTALLSIYEDSSKSTLIGNNSIVVEGHIKAPRLESLKELRPSPPENAEPGLFYLPSANCEKEWFGFENRICSKNPLGHWDSWLLVNSSWFVFVEDEQVYAKCINGKWEYESNLPLDSYIWDKYLAPEISMAPGTNPTKQMYKVLKLLNRFKNCQDA